MKYLKRAAKILFVLLVLAVALLAGGLGWIGWEMRGVGAGYIAKVLATGVFVLHRSPESICENELRYIPFVHYEINHDAKTVTAWSFPPVRRTAAYREGLGVALDLGGGVPAIQAQARPGLDRVFEHLKEQPWPMGDAPSGQPTPGGYDQAKLSAAVDHMFSEPQRFPTRNTRAVIIAYKGEIIAEQYAPGFGPEQRLTGWSAGKSIFNALMGIAVRDGKIKISDKAPVPAWQSPGDLRGAITIDMLMRMHSGVSYSDFDFETRPLVTELLFAHSGAAEYFMSRPLRYSVDTTFQYASGSTNLLSWSLRQAYGDDAYYALPYNELFSKIGMRSALFEADATGTLIGSSFFFATARDFIRFGLLYQNDGVWQGQRILPEGWVKYSRTPSPDSEYYGAHWWLSTAGDRANAKARDLVLPEDAFQAAGMEGQKLLVISSMQLVMVRLGLCHFSDFPLYEEFWNVLDAFPSAHIPSSAELATAAR